MQGKLFDIKISFLTFKIRVGDTPLTNAGQTKSGNPLCGQQSMFNNWNAITFM